MKPLTVGAALAAAVLAGCSGGKGAGGTVVRGHTSSGYFYPEFQRFRITAVRVLPDTHVPDDLVKLPQTLRDRSIYLSGGYIALPAAKTGADLLVPACFKASEGKLQVLPALSGEQVFSSFTLHTDETPATATLSRMFELTLQPAQPPADEGYQKRLFDELLNAHVLHDVRPGVGPECELGIVSTPALVNHDLALEATDLGRRHIDKGGDLDVHSAMASVVGLSKDWRRKLDPGNARNTLSGCIGREASTRIVSLRSADNAAHVERRLLDSLTGTNAAGEACERVRYERRLDPARLLLLYDVVIDEELANSGEKLNLELLRWVREGVFALDVNGYELELTTFEDPHLQVTLLRRPQLSIAAAARTPAVQLRPAPASAPRGDARQETVITRPPAAVSPSSNDEDPDRPTEKKMYRWVERDGSVHYSDRPRGGG